MTEPIYAIGDIHGHLDKLETALALVEADGGVNAHIVFLGDYVDRGPDSSGVIERLSAGLDAGRNWTCLLGNHDRMMRMFLGDPPRSDPQLLIGLDWFHEILGGRNTLASYGITLTDGSRVYQVHHEARARIPEHHIRFLDGLHTSFETPDLFFAHAGIEPGVPLDAQTEDTLTWIRKPFHDFRGEHPKLIVHGHTPVRQAMHYGNRINLDSGAGHGRRLTAARFDGTTCHVLTETGPQLLSPKIG